jgi:hypothetical protein
VYFFVFILLKTSLFFLALSHHYGKEGRDTKQIESKGILLDFELFQNMSTNTFTNAITDKLKQFIELLNNDNTNKGRTFKIYLIKYAYY